MTKAIPDGMHTVTPHLICKGAAEAIVSKSAPSGPPSYRDCRARTAGSCTP